MEVYPTSVVQNRYERYGVPIPFREAFDVFIEQSVMQPLGNFIELYGENRELFREKYILYIIELFSGLKKRLEHGVIFGNFDPKIPYTKTKEDDAF